MNEPVLAQGSKNEAVGKGKVMMARDLFGVGCRLLGLYLIQYGAFDFIHALYEIAVLAAGMPLPPRFIPADDLVSALALFGVGLFFLFGANLITRLLYGREISGRKGYRPTTHCRRLIKGATCDV